jgi:2-dehydro-3-deoxy-D-pentonate aldolase
MNEHASGNASRHPRPLRGVVPPLATPLRGRDQLDHIALARLVDRVVAGGVHGLFVLGTTGEAAALSTRLRRELVDLVVELVEGRIPILVGVSDTALVESLAAAEHAARAGADAIVATTPYYLPLEQPELLDYFRSLHDESPLPLYLYNMPGLTKTWISLDVIGAAMELPNVVGLKDSSGDLAYFAEVAGQLGRRPDWSLLIGPEMLMVDAIARGGHGCVGGGANVHPQLFVRLFEAVVRGDPSKADRLQEEVTQLSVLYDDGLYGASAVRGIKCALSLLGLCHEQMAAPFRPVLDEQRALIAESLRKLGLC